MADTQTLTIAEFLLARIAEDENWTRYMRAPETVGPVAQHMLAECEAKRRIVENYANLTAAAEKEERPPHETEYDETAIVWHAQGLHEAVSDLAQVYADHPDFREEWRA